MSTGEIAVLVVSFFLLIGVLALLCLKNSPAGSAIFRDGFGGPKLSADALVVIPLIQTYRVLDLTIIPFALSFRGPEESLMTEDGQMFDLEIGINFRLSDKPNEALYAIRQYGVDALNNGELLRPLIEQQATKVIQSESNRIAWADVQKDPKRLKGEISRALDSHLSGLLVDRVAFDHLDKFPPEYHSAQGTKADELR
ncbi:MAG: SPFH domain-containing protein [Verrucomicrobiota bacterium]